MPIFGGHNATTAGGAGRGHAHGSAAPVNNYDNAGFANTRNPAAGPGTMAPENVGYNQDINARTSVTHPGTTGTQTAPATNMAPPGSYENTVGNNEVAPVRHFGSGQSKGTGSSVAGKVERVVGSMVCSQSLKTKGMEKERAAQAKQNQRVELAEAERLEKEALARRERAVAHGAHPANSALGGATNAAQAQEFGGNFGQTANAGAGANAGNSAVPMARGGRI